MDINWIKIFPRRMKISKFQKEEFGLNSLKSVICSSNIGPKWAVIPFTKGGIQKVPYNQQVFFFKNPATYGFLKLQTGVPIFTNPLLFHP